MKFLLVSLLPALAIAQSTNWTKPTIGQSFVYSINDPVTPIPIVSNGLSLTPNLLDVDLFGTSAATISKYAAKGINTVCYFSAGSYEEDRPDNAQILPQCYCNKSSKCKMKGWDEYWFDVRSSTCVKNLQQVMTARIKLAKSKGCTMVDPDNVDSYTNNVGFGTTQADQLAYLNFLATTAHANGLGIALKNSPDMISAHPEVVQTFDMSIIEECLDYNECSVYKAFINAGKPAYIMEYEMPITCNLAGFGMLQYDDSYALSYKNLNKVCFPTATPSSSAAPSATSNSKKKKKSGTRRKRVNKIQP